MKRGMSIAGLGTLALSIVIVAVILLVGFTVITKTNQSVIGPYLNVNTHATYNISNLTAGVIQGVWDIGTWIPLIVLVAIGGFLIYIVMGSFGGGDRQ